MRMLLLVFILLADLAIAGNGPYLREYGVATTINFVLYTTAGVLDQDEADGGAEVTMSCDEAVETGTGIGTFVDEGTFYSIALDATAMSCARIQIIVAATDTESFSIDTFGHPSAGIVSFDPYRFSGVADATGTTTTTDLTGAASASDDAYNENVLRLYDASADEWYEAVCTDYVGATNVCTHTTIPAAIVSGDGVIVLAETKAVLTVDASGNVGADVNLIEASDATDQIDAALVTYDAATGTEIAAVPAAVWAVNCEDQGSAYTCQEALSIILAEAAGVATYTSGTRTWVVSDPSGGETRLTLVYGAELDGDRSTSTPAPMTP